MYARAATFQGDRVAAAPDSKARGCLSIPSPDAHAHMSGERWQQPPRSEERRRCAPDHL